MLKGVRITIFVIIATVIIVGGFDIAAVYFFGVDATISVVITKYSHQFPAIPFAFGFLMGHFFAQNSD